MGDKRLKLLTIIELPQSMANINRYRQKQKSSGSCKPEDF
jgi:hypothetical protein